MTLVASLWGYVIHANLRWQWRWLQPWLTTPAFHHWHHQHLGPGDRGRGNFAAFLPVMDRLFGTWHLPAASWPERYGTDEPPLPTMLDELLAPFMGPARRR